MHTELDNVFFEGEIGRTMDRNIMIISRQLRNTNLYIPIYLHYMRITYLELIDLSDLSILAFLEEKLSINNFIANNQEEQRKTEESLNGYYNQQISWACLEPGKQPQYDKIWEFMKHRNTLMKLDYTVNNSNIKPVIAKAFTVLQILSMKGSPALSDIQNYLRENLSVETILGRRRSLIIMFVYQYIDPPPLPPPSSSNYIADVLQRNGLGKYTERMVARGYTQFDTIALQMHPINLQWLLKSCGFTEKEQDQFLAICHDYVLQFC